MTGEAVNRHTVGSVLACGHILYTTPTRAPRPGVLMWCARCKGNTHFPFPMELDLDGNPAPGEWTWKCLMGKNCNGGQHGHGASRDATKYAAGRHSRKYPTHEIWLISPTGVVDERWGPDTYGAPEPLWHTPSGVAMWREKEPEWQPR